MKLYAIKTAYHRNGITGNGFHIILFKHDKKEMVGIVFEESGSVAVLDRGLLSKGEISFGVNSHRGDMFEKALRKAILR